MQKIHLLLSIFPRKTSPEKLAILHNVCSLEDDGGDKSIGLDTCKWEFKIFSVHKARPASSTPAKKRGIQGLNFYKEGRVVRLTLCCIV